MRDEPGEHVWTKRGSKVQLPPVPRPSRATLLRVIPGLGVASLALIGLLAVPAGSPTPPPPAVAAAPIVSSTPVPLDTPPPEPTPTEIISSDPPPPHCFPRAHALSRALRTGTLVYADIHHDHVYVFEPETETRTLVLEGKACGFSSPRFVDAHTIAYNLSSNYIREIGSFVLDLPTGRMERIKGSRRDWSWLAVTTLSADGSKLAELGSLNQAKSFLLRVTSTRSGAVVFSRYIGSICYCDGLAVPLDVRWSADGRYLLVAVSGQTENELFLMNSNGKDVGKQFVGAYPRWVGTSHSFIYKDSKSNWVKADSLTATPRAFLETGTTFADPAFSPDAGKIAFWDTDRWNIAVYDFTTKNLSRFGRLQVNPLWLDNGTIAVSEVRPCGCEGYGFEFTGVGWSLTLRTGGMDRIQMLSVEADVLR